MIEPAIAVLPYGGKLGRGLAARPLADLQWPLGCPARLEGGVVGDLSPDDHLIVYAKTAMHIQPNWNCRAHVSLMVMEPKAISHFHHRMLRITHRRFFRVFTHDPDLLQRLPNALFLPFGTTWVPDWQDRRLEKSEDLSLIASAKRDLEGHQLRHQMVEFLRQERPDARILGRGYTPFEVKADGLAPFRYSVVIENVQEPNYFSEKLIDAILCETVPIYWGCPNIETFFDTQGIICCSGLADLKAAVRSISEEDYQRRLPALRAIKSLAADLGDLPRRAAESLRDSL
ncbi:hypothetical protein PXK00_12685 [Phaeobacter sp. QD34_3]|uniref:hypothetical protein n=1 Tax=unclassified Phaeobacter TaxID=2621772 RepID=UPI00237F2F34|nr:MULTISPECIES: hypothetical protein [unclassified Phaeobacter]MDE4133972.1 hypothetical protein [Phaeobacter sp. QD34_3]MDE4137571.1 hypothetical protein [Phaeobacter sp. QD34_24]